MFFLFYYTIIMTKKDILYFGTCVVGLGINSICACCSSEEKKLSKEYIAKALGVTVDKVWAFDVCSFDDAAKHIVKNEKYSGLKTSKILVDNSSDGRYSNSCFVMLHYKNKSDNKLCFALVSDKNNIKVNNKMLEPSNLCDENVTEEKDGVRFMIVKDIDSYYNSIVDLAAKERIKLDDNIQIGWVKDQIIKIFKPQKKYEEYICK